MADRQRDIALFRYSLIRAAADPQLSNGQRGQLIRALADQDHLGPGGQRVRISRATLDRWLRAYRSGGFEALHPKPRKAEAKTPRELLDLAEDLKRETPRRTAAQIARIIHQHLGEKVSPRTLQRHFSMLGLTRSSAGTPVKAHGRFEAENPNDLWTGDALHGPVIGGRKADLFAFIDDCARLLTGYRWGYAEDYLRLEAAFRAGLASRGVPEAVYVDNGSAFASKELLRSCAVLGIRLLHSQPGQPAGRGKIERFFKSVRDQFLVEIEANPTKDLDELNRLFSAWVEGVYHHTVHSETGDSPLGRFSSAPPPQLPTPADLRAAFLWAEKRVVTKTATVSLWANRYEVDAALVGRNGRAAIRSV